MPEPAETIDVCIDYGIVRVYRFDELGAAGAPLVLLPGRASGVPVWADYLPSLLQISDVYAVGLLGEPGVSIQSRPIASDADQAAWLNQPLEALPEDTFHVVGLSIGGWTAANLVLHQPEHVATLTRIDPVLVFADTPRESSCAPCQRHSRGCRGPGETASIPARRAALRLRMSRWRK